jgi:hypothetical protein
MPDDVLDVAEAPWRERLGGDPLPWLLETKAPAVRAATLTRLLDRPNEPGFECAANEGFSCAWGAIKELSGLALILREQRSPAVQEAIEVGVEFLFSRDPAVSDYPMGDGDAVPSRSWVKLGFPSEYVADVLQNLEVLAHLGYAKDPRLDAAYDFVLSQRDEGGRWRNRYAYNRKTTVDTEPQGDQSKWVTLRACTVLKARHG